MKLTKSKYFILSYRPLILAYAGGPESTLDLELLHQSNVKPIVLQFISWSAGHEGTMLQYRDYQQCLEEQGIEHHLMVNAPEEDELRYKFGVRGALCSKNLFCDENVFDIFDVEKVFDAIYVARLQKYKRLELARDVKKLIILSYGGDLPAFCPDVSHAVYNKVTLPPRFVAGSMQQSFCGLCLSEVEGQMRAAVEYLLCGIPVVTTPSLGGRDLFFDNSNSLTVEPCVSDVASAVDHWKESPPDPYVIRSNVMEAINRWRDVLGKYVADIINSNSAGEVDVVDLKTRLFETPGCLNDRLITDPSIHDPETMAPYAIENHSLRLTIRSEVKIGEGEAGRVVVENESGSLLQLDEVSAAVLNACFRSMSIADILTLFRKTYPDAPESMDEDITGILESLFTYGIIDVHEH